METICVKNLYSAASPINKRVEPCKERHSEDYGDVSGNHSEAKSESNAVEVNLDTHEVRARSCFACSCEIPTTYMTLVPPQT